MPPAPGVTRRLARLAILMASALALTGDARSSIIWSRSGSTLVHDNSPGESLLHGEIAPHDRSAHDTLYFKFDVEPLSDPATENTDRYDAGMVLFADGREHLGVGNAWKSWGYSAFNVAGQGPANDIYGEFNLPSAYREFTREIREKYEYPRRSVPRTIVFKVQFLPGELAQVTTWLDPDLSAGATEAGQSPDIETHFRADATFDDIRLLHRGGGDGWVFRDLVIATNFDDIVQRYFWQEWWFIALASGAALVSVALAVRGIERRRARRQIAQLERERAVSAERERIARDIHDELGAELAQIGLLADIGGSNRTNSTEIDGNFSRIARRARSVVASLDEIVWAVDPHNDNLEHLADYLCHIADECLADSPIRCWKEVPTGLPAFPVSAELRHDLTLAVKEAFTNLLRHSGGSEARLRLSWCEPDLAICVEDNGCGIAEATTDEGNGLRNQRTRLERNGGTVELHSEADRGTRVVFRVRLTSHTRATNEANALCSVLPGRAKIVR